MGINQREKHPNGTIAIARMLTFMIVLGVFGAGGVYPFMPVIAGAICFSIIGLIFALVGIIAVRYARSDEQKLGVILIMMACFSLCIWWFTGRDIRWEKTNAFIVDVIPAKAITNTVYIYKVSASRGELEQTALNSALWDSREQANLNWRKPIPIYYDTSHPERYSFFTPNNRMRKTIAHPVSTKIKDVEKTQLLLNISRPYFTELKIPAPGEKTYRKGDRISVWVNPRFPEKVSLEATKTQNSPTNQLLLLVFFPLLCAVILYVFRKREAPVNVFLSDQKGTALKVEVVEEEKELTIMDRLHAIDWFQFEKVAYKILEKEGWAVQARGGASPDGGADLLAVKENVTAVVQCKHWHNIEVQVSVLRELLGTMNSALFSADTAMLFTLSNCTIPAKQFADENGISIFNAEDIAIRISIYGIQNFPELLNPEEKYCPKCGAPMIWRDNAKVPFWGCSMYPRCKGVIKVH